MPRANSHWSPREEEAARLTRMLMHGFYEKTIHPKDMVPYLSAGHFVWIGAADGELYTSVEEGISAFSAQRDMKEVPIFHISAEQYRPSTIAPTVFLVIATAKLDVDPSSKLVISENQRGTFLFRLEKGEMKLVHIHVSNPWTIMAKEHRFPVTAGRSNYEYMQQLIASQKLADFPDLSKRQQVVLELIAQGKTNKEIAAALSLTEHTVRYHVSALLAKFKVKNRTELIAVAAQNADKGNLRK